MTVSWIEHEGKRILFSDYRGLHEEQMLAQLKEEETALLAESTPVLMLVDVTGCGAHKSFLDAAGKQGARLKEKIEKQAIIGLDVIKSFFISVYNATSKTGMRTYTTKEGAIDWLVK